MRPPETCWSIAYSSASRTGSFVVMSVVEVDTISRSVCAATAASSVVGDEDMKGGLWCSPKAKTSRPTSSVCFAIARTALIRSASLGVAPVTGFLVTSPTENTPNCIWTTLLIAADAVSAIHAIAYNHMRGPVFSPLRTAERRRSGGGEGVPEGRERPRRPEQAAAGGEPDDQGRHAVGADDD